MFLAIDIGNTNITFGLFKFNGKNLSDKPLQIWAVATSKKKTADEYAIKILDILYYSNIDLKKQKIKNIAIASVVPSLDTVFANLTKKYFNIEAFFVNSKNSGGLKYKYANPDEIGADRIADAVAVYKKYKTASIVIDFGTATTFDCIDKKGWYLGGVITAGPLISAEALSNRTAKLPLVNISMPPNPIGTTTVEGMQSGLYYGYIGLVKEILSRLKKQMKDKNIKIIATGGLSCLIAREIKEIETIIPELTINGIKFIWEKERKK
ncbi:type III pantothenate kinase [Candidatus Ruminimicrobium bovinum]|uniref:type III pantothenate kinase n=1 Tax=Candidatus Ruminimicrobium bovinum TaxID=3242779 RepID=UPI0039B9BD6D